MPFDGFGTFGSNTSSWSIPQKEEDTNTGTGGFDLGKPSTTETPETPQTGGFDQSFTDNLPQINKGGSSGDCPPGKIKVKFSLKPKGAA